MSWSSLPLVATYVRDKMPAGEALDKALADCYQDWLTIEGSRIRGPNDTLVDYSSVAYVSTGPPFMLPDKASGSGGKDRSRSPRGGKGGKGGQGQRTYRIGNQRLQLDNGQRLCGKFNGPNSCKHGQKTFESSNRKPRCTKA